MTDRLLHIAHRLSDEVDALRFDPPVAFVYNPLAYARAAHDDYVRRYARLGVQAVLVGMNPGPWGMVQTGVPFGEVGAVRDWLGIRAPVGHPATEHPKRRVVGLACARSEVSGARLWGWARDRFGTPEAFFSRIYVINLCPLAFLEDSGRNRTPDKLPKAGREPLLAACDAALRETISVLAPDVVVGVGAFAENRARAALAGLPVRVGRALHPSPASPAANRGWAAAWEADLAALGVRLPQAG